MRAPPGTDWGESAARVGPKVVTIRLAVSFGLALVTYQPRGGVMSRGTERRRDGRRGIAGHTPRRVEFFRNLPS